MKIVDDPVVDPEGRGMDLDIVACRINSLVELLDDALERLGPGDNFNKVAYQLGAIHDALRHHTDRLMVLAVAEESNTPPAGPRAGRG